MYDDLRPYDIDITPDSAAYSSGDVVGGLLTIVPTTNPSYLAGIRVSVGEASIAVPGTFYLYNNTPTSFADNAAFAPVHADNKLLVATVTMPTALTLNSRNVYDIKYGGGSTMPLIPVWSSSLFAYYVTSGTPDFAASQQISFRFFLLGGS